MATIRDIAALAGVSRGTVDRVLNKRGGVNRETQERILKIMEEVQFTRNRAGIDGLIMTPYDSRDVRKEMVKLREKNIPVITVNSDIENIKRLAYVGESHFKSGSGAAVGKISEDECNLFSGSRNLWWVQGFGKDICSKKAYRSHL